MDKLKMQTANKADENFKKLAEMFPNAVTETIDENGEVVRAIDKDVLMQEINTKVVDGNEERYQFTWPDKKKSVLLANAPINKTLRPCREESVDFDNTENLYIEGDNLEVLKLLQETYLGKIKMIYIDPPYNTGNDFVYEDDFAISMSEYLANSGQYDAEFLEEATLLPNLFGQREGKTTPNIFPFLMSIFCAIFGILTILKSTRLFGVKKSKAWMTFMQSMIFSAKPMALIMKKCQPN